MDMDNCALKYQLLTFTHLEICMHTYSDAKSGQCMKDVQARFASHASISCSHREQIWTWQKSTMPRLLTSMGHMSVMSSTPYQYRLLYFDALSCQALWDKFMIPLPCPLGKRSKMLVAIMIREVGPEMEGGNIFSSLDPGHVLVVGVVDTSGLLQRLD